MGTIEIIQAAIDTKKILKLSYEENEISVCPLAIGKKNNIESLLAAENFGKNIVTIELAINLYELNKIKNIELTNQSFIFPCETSFLKEHLDKIAYPYDDEED